MNAILCNKCGESRPRGDFYTLKSGGMKRPCRFCIQGRLRERHAERRDVLNARRRVIGSPKPTAAQRFAAKVVRGGPDECWPWVGHTVGDGYGHFGCDSRQVLAHRFAYQLANGPLDASLKVLHRCDNPPCCNPAHLFVGTQADNVRDMLSKGRARPAVGERHPKAKVPTATVLHIRSSAARGESVSAIAKRLKLPRSTVGGIVSGKSRKTEVLA